MDVDNSLVEQSFHLERLSVSIKIIDRAMASSSPSLVGHFRLSRRREPLSSSFFFFLHSIILEPNREPVQTFPPTRHTYIP